MSGAAWGDLSLLALSCKLLVAAGIALAPAGVLAQEPLRLSLPLACAPGVTCFIQHYVDIDTGEGARDFRCGTATYDGHKGVDFRVHSAAAAKVGVDVLAAAPGIVKGRRDGMTDAFARETGKSGITNRECGNGMVLDHGHGWETQYCHLRRGSVVVRQGERVARGQKLGEVGWSGLADFAHLHLSVRKDGQVVEPFTGGGQTGLCVPDMTAGGLWDDSVAKAFPYRNGEIIELRATDEMPTTAMLEHDHTRPPQPTITSGRLVFYARLLNMRQGDLVRFAVDGPGGFELRIETQPWPRHRQVEVVGVARALKAASWQAGAYAARASLLRDGAVITERHAVIDLR